MQRNGAEDVEVYIEDLLNLQLTLFLPKFARVREVLLEIFGMCSKYRAGGVIEQDGCIYFSPTKAGKMLSINM